ncbi:MAG: leucyl aminopeptidase [bacterium]|nr:leucyl aminopeptidase [bacterium]
MNIKAVRSIPKRGAKETYVVFLGNNEVFEPLHKEDQWAKQALLRESFKGEYAEIAILSSPEPETPRYICVGAGDTRGQWAQLVGTACSFLQKKKIATYTVVMPTWQALHMSDMVRTSVVALYASTYHFDRYITDPARKVVRPTAVFLYVPEGPAIDEALRIGKAVGEAADHAREMGNMPPLDMTPIILAREAKKCARGKLKVRTLGPAQLKKEKMGGILAVSQGSKEDAQLIIMEYMGGKKKDKPLVFAGKAVTFDSGGISIKPSQKMDEMKFDMLGGATVIALVHAVAALSLPINIVGLIGASENVLGEGAYRPGDIITAKNGKTIEIINTDAEGRVILADVLSYAALYTPRVVIDLATLTGACVVALGDRYAGLFTRDEKIGERLVDSGNTSGEYIWRLPLDDEFGKNVQSTIADTRNAGIVHEGGASQAAAFLEKFVSYPWAHIDIAGTAWGSEKSFRSAGATGAHIDALLRFIQSYL